MKGWIELCSDVNWEDYHGMWARRAQDGSWYVLVWTNMWDACGEEEGLEQYHCEVKRIDFDELDSKEIDTALSSCGVEYDSAESLRKQSEPILVECCIQYGLGAPLESFSSSARPIWLRAKARRYAERCMKDAELLERQLERPVNAIGSTAREYGRGDVQSAMLRGDSTAHQILRKMHGAPDEHRVQFGTLQPDGTLSNVRNIRQSDLQRCPHVIMVPEHYRDDGSCRCDDPEHQQTMIKEWGYEEKDFAGSGT